MILSDFSENTPDGRRAIYLARDDFIYLNIQDGNSKNK
ncbi:hypothetical protein NIES23_39480 [Trichormus variabilis NIES-23]|uniref:Uncharacterized protein n=1 Tax=Trichormus variabilis NIES-23 TaxID=1973479 RepID=A0A1Z4KQ82_ANAVA|nr:hypothetical protein NIES23_39480 [Trichormus variabilis NIES-23]